jgi:hypothetical protein
MLTADEHRRSQITLNIVLEFAAALTDYCATIGFAINWEIA